MATVTLKNNPVKTVGDLPSVGAKAPDFTLTNAKWEEIPLSQFAGKRKILTINPSLDTGICATAARKFNEKAGSLKNAVVLVITTDLPPGLGRFCEANGIKNVEALSTFRSSFSKDYGTTMVDGYMRGMNSRAIVVLDENNKVLYTEQVPAIGQEPDYDKAYAALH